MPKRLSGETTSNVNITIGSGNLEGNFIGDLTGNATTATKASSLNLSSAGLVQSNSSGAISVTSLSTAGAVLKTGDETIAGVKTFSSDIVGRIDEATKALGLNLTTAGYVKCDANGAMSVDSTSQGSLLTPDQSGKIQTNHSKVGVSASSISSAGAVLKTGDETIAGVKTFSSDIVGRIDEATKALGLNLTTAGYVKCDANGAMSVDSTSQGSLLTTDQAGQISTNNGKVGVTTTNMKDRGGVVTINVAQTIQGVKTFSSDIVGRIDEATKALGLNLTTAGYVKCDANGAMSVDSTSQGSLLTTDQAGQISTNNAKPTTSAVGTLISNAVSTINTALSSLSSTVTTNATKYVHVYNSGFQTSTTNKNFWIPIRGTGEVANSSANNPLHKMEQCTFLAPHDGIVKKILFRTETSMGSGVFTEASFKLCKANSGIELPSLSNQVGSTYSKTSSITDDTTYSRNDLSGDYNWILQENVLYGLNISMLAAPIDMVFAMVVEYTI